MALGRVVATNVASCSWCGAPLKRRSREAQRRIWLALAGVLALLVLGALFGEPKDEEATPAETAEYQRIRSECMVIAAKQLDTRFYRIGGNEWVDLVNDCMVKKASD